MKLSSKQTGHAIIFVVVTIFAINIPITKYLLTGHISPLGITGLRALTGCVVFWMASLLVGIERVQLKDHWILIIGGVCGIILRQGLFVIGLDKSSPIDGAIIISSSPIFAMIIAAIVLKELISFQKVVGVLLGATGATILVYMESQAVSDLPQSTRVISDLFMMGSALTYAIYLVITKPLTSRYSALTMMKWMFTYAAIVGVICFHQDMIHAPLFYESNHRALWTLAYPLIVATCIAYVLIPMAQKRIRSTTIAMYNNMQPVIASTIAILVGQDQLSWTKVISVVLVLMGVYLVTQSKSTLHK